MTDMKKILRETLIEKNVLFFATGGVSAAVISTSDVKTAVACALSVVIALTSASVAAAFASRLTGRFGVWTVYITVSSGLMAACASAASNFVTGTAYTLTSALLAAAVSGVALSCVPKKDEPIPHSVVRASLTSLMYALILTVLAFVRFALCRISSFAASPAMTLILTGFIVASVNFLFVSIAERKERAGREVTEDDR